MEFHQLRYVLAVARTRNFTRASRELFVVQSALSQQIAKLESELGTPLFARTSRHVELTAAGEAFLPWARTCLEAADRAAAEAAAAAGVIRGPLRIGLIPTVAALDVPRLIGDLRRAHPDLQVQLSLGGSNDLLRGVRDGELELAVLGLADGVTPTGVAKLTLAREPLVAAVPDAPRWASRDTVGLDELAAEPFADFSTGTPGREQTDRAFESAGLTRSVAYEAATAEQIGSLVAAGLAVALLPEPFARMPGVRTLAVPGGPHRTEYLIWRATDPSPAVQAALTLVGAPAPRATS